MGEATRVCLRRRRALGAVAASAVALVLMASGNPALAAREGAGAGTRPAATVPVPDSIDRTGGQDVTDALNAFLAKVPRDATVSFPRNARYKVDGVLRLVGREGVTVEGNGATFVAPTDATTFPRPKGRFRLRWPRNREHWSVTRGSRVTIRDITIEGPNHRGVYDPRFEGQAGVSILGTAGVVLERVKVHDTYGDGIYVAGRASDVVVRDAELVRNGRQGVGIVNGDRVTIERSTVRDAARSAFDVEPASPRWSVDTVHLRDNTIEGYTNYVLAAGGAGQSVTDVWLEGNRITRGRGLTVFAGTPRFTRQGLHIVGNTSTVASRSRPGAAHDALMELQHLDGVEIRDNRTRVEGRGAVVSLDDVCRLTMTGNRFDGAARERLEVHDCGSGTSATPPSTRRAPARSPRTTPATAAPETAKASASDGSGFGAGVVVGLAVAAAALLAGAGFVAFRRRGGGGKIGP